MKIMKKKLNISMLDAHSHPSSSKIINNRKNNEFGEIPKNFIHYLCCLLFIKLKIPDGLEKSDRNDRLSPIIGQPMLPGIPSIAFGEVPIRIKQKAEARNMKRSNMINKMLGSIFNHLSQYSRAKYKKVYQIGIELYRLSLHIYILTRNYSSMSLTIPGLLKKDS